MTPDNPQGSRPYGSSDDEFEIVNSLSHTAPSSASSTQSDMGSLGAQQGARSMSDAQNPSRLTGVHNVSLRPSAIPLPQGIFNNEPMLQVVGQLQTAAPSPPSPPQPQVTPPGSTPQSLLRQPPPCSAEGSTGGVAAGESGQSWGFSRLPRPEGESKERGRDLHSSLL